jgi:hypothetical protein
MRECEIQLLGIAMLLYLRAADTGPELRLEPADVFWMHGLGVATGLEVEGDAHSI